LAARFDPGNWRRPLAIARNAAEAHGGRISLAANPSGGASAIIALPLFRPAAATAAAAAAENVPS
jgi:hypothetical protein